MEGLTVTDGGPAKYCDDSHPIYHLHDNRRRIIDNCENFMIMNSILFTA
jgi:hypothetical protein